MSQKAPLLFRGRAFWASKTGAGRRLGVLTMALAGLLALGLSPLGAQAQAAQRGPCFAKGWYQTVRGQHYVFGTILGSANIGVDASVQKAAQGLRTAFAKNRRGFHSAAAGRVCYQGVSFDGKKDRFLVMFAVELNSGDYHWSAIHATGSGFWAAARKEPWVSLKQSQGARVFRWGEVSFAWLHPQLWGLWREPYVLYEFRLPGAVNAGEPGPGGLASAYPLKPVSFAGVEEETNREALKAKAASLPKPKASVGALLPAVARPWPLAEAGFLPVGHWWRGMLTLSAGFIGVRQMPFLPLEHKP